MPEPGTGAEPSRTTTRDVLGFATADGATAIGLHEVTGRTRPGLAADLRVIGADDVNTMPLDDAVATVVLGADPRSIRAVVVAGEFRTRGWSRPRP